MKEYIERDAILEEIKVKANALHKFRSLYTDQSARAFDGLAEYIAKIPAADVAPVVRCKDCQYKSEWIKNGYGEYFCRKSGLWNLSDVCFCHCGTRMDGEKKSYKVTLQKVRCRRR